MWAQRQVCLVGATASVPRNCTCLATARPRQCLATARLPPTSAVTSEQAVTSQPQPCRGREGDLPQQYPAQLLTLSAVSRTTPHIQLLHAPPTATRPHVPAWHEGQQPSVFLFLQTDCVLKRPVQLLQMPRCPDCLRPHTLVA